MSDRQTWRRALPVALAGLAMLVACAQPPAPPAVDLAAEEQAIRDASMAWMAAVEARDFAAAAAFFAPDGTTFPENQDPVMGPAAIQANAEAQWAETPNASVSWSTDMVVLATSGDLAYEVGTWTFANEGMEDTGKYLTVWRKVEGAWKAAADMSVSTVPESEASEPM